MIVCIMLVLLSVDNVVGSLFLVELKDFLHLVPILTFHFSLLTYLLHLSTAIYQVCFSVGSRESTKSDVENGVTAFIK